MVYEDYLELIMNRRSCRKFKSDRVSDDLMNKILVAGRWTPSAHNLQNTYSIRINDPEIRKEIVSNVKSSMGLCNCDCDGCVNDGFDPFYGAPEIIMVLARGNLTHFTDGALVMENMVLAAESLGLGACWINTAQYHTNHDLINKISEICCIKEHVRGVGYLAIGYRDELKEPPLPRKDGRIFTI